MAYNDVFPRNNLNPDSVPWGRAVEGSIRDLSYQLEVARQASNGDNRTQAGQFGVLSRQIEELNGQVTELTARRTMSVTPADLSVTGNATITPLPSATRTFDFPAPDDSRAGVLLVSATFTNSNNTQTARAFVEILFQSQVILRWDGAVPNNASAPAGWTESMSVARSITIPSGTAPVFTIRVSRLGFTTTTTTITMNNISATLQYGDKV